ncbi:dUTPase [Epinotia aporema granulovirus]|uniref:dUTP diphosphatase n=1 Tax=Epinotia aporema granulovirus TaxID=166056 RepID=K4ER52_9BBAC|nr:dUTPase [Epinotia aporema granulovirus]AER41439.1 dUTPase [Epinotia aporema granulovirus]
MDAYTNTENSNAGPMRRARTSKVATISMQEAIEEQQQLIKTLQETNKKTTQLQFFRITENAFAPTKGSDRAAGFDLKSGYDTVIPKHGKGLVMTDLRVQLPVGCYGRIAPRSGLAVKHFIDVGAGVIDEDYRGNVGVVLFNHSDTDFVVNKGDRIAQLICEQIFYPTLVEVTSTTDTNRGEGGFGSTGTN